MSGLKRFTLNVSSSWLATAVRIAANLLLMPYLVYRIGTDSYGVFRTVTGFLVCASLLDFGLGMAVRRFSARYAALKSNEDQSHLMSTAVVIFTGSGLVAFLVAVAIAPSSPWLFKDIPESLAHETVSLCYLIGVTAFLRLAAAPYMGFLQGLQQIHRYNIAIITSNVLRLVATVAVLELLSPNVVYVGWVTMAGELASISILVLSSFRAWPGLRIRPRLFSRQILSQIGGFAASAFVISLGGLVQYQVPNFIVSKSTGPTAVTLLSVGVVVSMVVREVIGALSAVLMPMFSESEALDNRQILEARLWQGSLFANAMGWMIIGGVVVYARPLILQWLGPGLEQAYWALLIMAVGESSAGVSAAASSALAGYGHLRWLMVSRIVAAAFTLAMVLAAVTYFDAGIAGVALGITLPNMVRGFWMGWYCTRRLELPFWPYFRRSVFKPLAATAIIVLVSLGLSHVYPVTSRISLAVTVAILGIVAGSLGFGVVLPANMRKRLLNSGLALLKRRRGQGS